MIKMADVRGNLQEELYSPPTWEQYMTVSNMYRWDTAGGMTGVT
jgi:hypothetical protein